MNIINKRQGQAEFRQCYFYTDTIIGFSNLLADDNLKMIIINSWKYMIEKGDIEIYGYVIMPNHIHIIWNFFKMNGKESPAGSFAKFTAHKFKEYLLINDLYKLENYRSDKIDRQYQFWKRDPLAIPLSTEKILIQKLQYIHDNPVKEKWSLSVLAEEYRWSSAKFYDDGTDEFNLLTHYKDAG